MIKVVLYKGIGCQNVAEIPSVFVKNRSAGVQDFRLCESTFFLALLNLLDSDVGSIRFRTIFGCCF